jgi:hypothetical protein
MILSVADFIGKYELHTGMYDQNKIQAYIDKYEPRYLRQLLGVDLAADFVGDLNNQQIPKSPNFLEIYNPFAFDSGYNFYLFNGIYEGTGQLLSDGIKEMLLGFIYFEYAKDLVNQMTPFGNVKPKSENSDIANTLFSMMYTRYNESITSYRAIQHYVRMNNPAQGQIGQITNLSPGSGYVNGTYPLTSLTGSGATVAITAKPIGETKQIAVANGGTGYIDGQYFTFYLGTGVGLVVNCITDGLGVIISATIEPTGEGIGYQIGDQVIVQGGNNDALITITDVWNGEVITFTLVTEGINFVTGQVATVQSGDINAQVSIVFAGIGDYRKFRGLKKSTAYWL